MTKKLLPSILSMVLVLLLASCRNSQGPSHPLINVILPSSLFGKAYADLEAEAQKLGQKSQKDLTKRTLTITTNTRKDFARTIVLQFDAEGNYRYATEKLADINTEKTFVESLLNQGFSQDKQATKAASEGVFTHKERGWVVFISHRSDSDISYVFAPKDEATTSWSRTETKTHETGLWAPLMGLGNTLDLVLRFEARQGHTLDLENTSIEKGYYSFKTNNPDFPATRYWLDKEKKSFLEECAIFVNIDKRPSPDAITEYMRTMGFLLTTLVDQGNPVYYSKETGMAAVAEMNKPKDATTFAPKVQFFKGTPDLANKIMKESLDIPMPILDFGKYTLDEAVELYKKQTYYKSSGPFLLEGIEFGKLIATTSPDFSGILLMEGEGDTAGKYAIAILLAENAMTVTSSYNEKFFVKQLGSIKVSGPAIPTYKDPTGKVMFQIDQSGTFSTYALAFSPNEF